MIDTEPQRVPEIPLLANLSGVTPRQNFEPLITAETAADLLGIHAVTLLK